MAVGRAAAVSEGADVVLDAASGRVEVPGGDMLLKADFVRQGPDLLLQGADGETVLIRGFFASGTPPELMTESGAVIPGGLAVKLAGPVAPGQVAQAGAADAGDAVGRVENAAGKVFITHADGTKVEAVVGMPVFQGDVVETEAGGSIGILFADDTTFSLGESGRMVLDEMVYDPAGPSGHAAINVVQGVFAFVSGQIAKTGDEAMTISTPVAVIGIRGTTVSGKAAQEGSASTITLLQDADGGVGQISVSNAVGVQVLSAPFQSTQVSSFYAPPAPPVVLPAAVVQQLYGAVVATVTAAAAAAAQDKGAAEEAFESAVSEGASVEEAFAAAAEADTAAAQETFSQALAGGASEEEALQAAGGVALSGIETDQFSFTGLADGFAQAIAGTGNPLAVADFVQIVAANVENVEEVVEEIAQEIFEGNRLCTTFRRHEMLRWAWL